MEDIVGMGPTDRARYLRTIVHELERLHSHMLWVGLGGHILGYWTVFMWGWKYREPVLDALEMITGNRNNYAWYRPGGVRRDVADEVWPEVVKIIDEFDEKIDLLIGAILDDPVIQGRLKGVGILTTEDAIHYGALGPTARGSGVDIDVRRDDPYGSVLRGRLGRHRSGRV